MMDDDRDAACPLGMRCSPVLTLLMALGLALLPLACMPSTADSKKEEEAPSTTASEEETEYDIPAYAGDRSVEERLQDASLAAQVTRALVRQRDLRIFDFEPAVDGQTVTVEGDVNTRAQWTQVGRVVERVADGRAVVNAVTIGGRPAEEVTEDGAVTATDASDQKGTSTTEVYHTVQPGESLWKIAQQYGASVQRLRGLNSLSTSNLSVGQRIRVR